MGRIPNFKTFTLQQATCGRTHVACMNDFFVNENKVQRVIDKIPVDELPQAESMDEKECEIGAYVSRSTLDDLYDEEMDDIMNRLKDGGILCNHFGSTVTWFQEKDGGLVRIQ